MNATATIYALALASNDYPQQHFQSIYTQLARLGKTQFSPIYVIPCRDGIGADYWNAACILHSHLKVNEMLDVLKQFEIQAGRVRPSHRISVDIDLIAWGEDLQHMQFNLKKLPLALDVKIPLCALWQHPSLQHAPHSYPTVGSI